MSAKAVPRAKLLVEHHLTGSLRKRIFDLDDADVQVLHFGNGIPQLFDLYLSKTLSLCLWDSFSFIVTALLVHWFHSTGHQGLGQDKSALRKITKEQAIVLCQSWGKGEEGAIIGCVLDTGAR